MFDHVKHIILNLLSMKRRERWSIILFQNTDNVWNRIENEFKYRGNEEKELHNAHDERNELVSMLKLGEVWKRRSCMFGTRLIMIFLSSLVTNKMKSEREMFASFPLIPNEWKSCCRQWWKAASLLLFPWLRTLRMIENMGRMKGLMRLSSPSFWNVPDGERL